MNQHSHPGPRDPGFSRLVVPDSDDRPASAQDQINELRDELTAMRGALFDMESQRQAFEAALVPALTEAVRKGVAAAVTEEATVNALLSMILKLLTARGIDQAGRWTLGWFKQIPGRLFTFALLGLLVYNLGGWSAVMKIWHILNPFSSGGGP